MPRMSVTRTRGERAVTAAPPALLAPMLSLSEQIAGQLAARITAGTYAPGQRIMEQAIAAEFGVSRGPVPYPMSNIPGQSNRT